MLSTLFTLFHLLPRTRPAVLPPIPITKNYNLSSIPQACHMYAYPSELRLMNSDYPHLDWNPGLFHMTSRNDQDARIWATQVQFQSVQATSSIDNSTLSCNLELVLPPDEGATSSDNDPAMRIYGPDPILNIYVVERAPSSPAPFASYEGAGGRNKTEAPIFATINGAPEATWTYRQSEDGTVKLGQVPCNETLTFQMGMKSPGVGWANYWAFAQVNAPAVPVQGWRIVHGC
ncbi:hypothetical protein BCR34DRAFT_312919 [Clohesyomyces aquaticus]|uniref:Ubiquitin 3 binding protein But2 C-terminal domain-containing protein n=1 Tax=Clohesyomyces aquaticus TaxID=1231657 RepID=A0A1Y1ZNV3_9PLEO|nr:hypothetical protein BCR34DRAFT_312919 [Clohesyomyces aquaticus]